jgi:hypothetical protein
MLRGFVCCNGLLGITRPVFSPSSFTFARRSLVLVPTVIPNREHEVVWSIQTPHFLVFVR